MTGSIGAPEKVPTRRSARGEFLRFQENVDMLNPPTQVLMRSFLTQFRERAAFSHYLDVLSRKS